MREVGAIEAHMPRELRPDTGDHPRQAGFSRSAGTNNPHHLAGQRFERNATQGRTRLFGRAGGDGFKLEMPQRPRQLQLLLRFSGDRKQLCQSRPAAAGAGHALPASDYPLDRGKRTADKNRCGDDHAGGDLIVDRQIGAKAQDHGLEKHPHELRRRRDQPGPRPGLRLQIERLTVLVEPGVAQDSQHPHRLNHFAVAKRRHRPLGCADRSLGGKTKPSGCHQFARKGQSEDDDRAADCDCAEPRMKNEAGCYKNRHPQQIAKRDQSGAGDEFANRIKVPQRLPLRETRKVQAC